MARQEDVVGLLAQQALTWWEERTGISRKHLSLIRRGQRQITPYEWARLVLAALQPERALQLAHTPYEAVAGFEEERLARAWTKGQFAGALGMSYMGYWNASLGFKNFGSAAQRALGWLRAGIDWRDYALLTLDDVQARQEQNDVTTANTAN